MTAGRRGRWRRRIVLTSLVLLLSAVAVVAICDRVVAGAADGACWEDATAIPHRRVALVLGTSRMLAPGRPNLLYRHRIDAAAALYAAGKVHWLLVSGDNRDASYDEPSMMKQDLIAAGVPATRIYRDQAGLRTLDSVVRAKEVFGLEEVTVVSQRFHNERALYLARAHGLAAIAFDAPGVASGATMLRNLARERLARVAAVLDVWLGREPRFLGPPIAIGVDPAN